MPFTPPPSASSPPSSAEAPPPPGPATGVTPPAAKPLPPVIQSCPADNDTRTIIVAFGVGFRPIDQTDFVLTDQLVSAGLQASKLTKIPDGFLYDACQNHRAAYGVKYVYTKADFKFYLQSPRVHLIYCGHSREGRGPCFLDKGTPEGPGEHWGDAGTFRMGFDFIGVPTSDIKEHQYTPRLVSPSETIDASKCEPVNLGKHYGSLGTRTTSAPPVVPSGQYQGYADPEEWLAVKCGADDLAQTKPSARVLCLFSCDTADYWKPTIQASGWKPSADSGFVYYTSATDAPLATTSRWLYNLLSYKIPPGKGGTPWKPSLDYAMVQTNADLATTTANKGWKHPALVTGWSIVT